MANGRAPVAVLLVGALLAPGCGNERRERVSLEANPSPKLVERQFPRVGLRLELPENVNVTETAPPGVFYGSFGEAVISTFAYRRREKLPRTDAQLREALDRLKGATRRRDSGYELSESTTTEVNGSRAAELVGDQTIDNKDLRTRSVHVYEGSAEYVFELLAPRGDFARLDRDLFEPVLDSVRLTGAVRRAKG